MTCKSRIYLNIITSGHVLDTELSSKYYYGITLDIMSIRLGLQTPVQFLIVMPLPISYSRPRPGNSAILLETGSIDHSRALSIPSALRVKEKYVNIAQYRALSIPSTLRVPEKKFPLILVRGS